MLGESEVRKTVAEVRRHEIRTDLFRPNDPSANRPKTAEPERRIEVRNLTRQRERERESGAYL